MSNNENYRQNQRRVPKRLYSYCRGEHLDKFLSTGELRIGTLFDFRDAEEHGDQIGDEEEGVISRIEHVEEVSGSQLSDFARRFVNIADDVAESGRFFNCTFNLQVNSANHYIFCASESSSWLDGKTMNAEYDSRIIIEEPMKFFLAIAQSMTGRIQQGSGLVKCEYREKKFDYREPFGHPIAIKSTDFAYQQEYRWVMVPKSDDIQPVIIKCPDAVRFCSGQKIRLPDSPSESASIQYIPRKSLSPEFKHGGSRKRKKRSKPVRVK